MSARHSLFIANCCRTFSWFVSSVMLVALPHIIHPMPALAVPAVENESVVVGEVLAKDIVDSSALNIQPHQMLLRLKLRIVSVESVAGAENFLRGQEGRTIEVFSNEVNLPAEAEKLLKLRIRYHGDERVGRYWIVGTIETKST